MDKKSSYILSVNIIRSIAIFGVIIIHTSNAIYTRTDFFGGAAWWIALILDSFSRISIPLFILISGYLLLGKNESFNKTFKRMISRILIPFLFWVLFYFWWAHGAASFRFINLSIVKKIFYADVFHLYFYS